MTYKKFFKRFKKPLVSCDVNSWKKIIIEAVFNYCLKKGIDIEEGKINLIQDGWQTANGKVIFAYAWVYPDEKIRHLLRIKIRPRLFRSGLKSKARIVVSKKWTGENALEHYKKAVSLCHNFKK